MALTSDGEVILQAPLAAARLTSPGPSLRGAAPGPRPLAAAGATWLGPAWVDAMGCEEGLFDGPCLMVCGGWCGT